MTKIILSMPKGQPPIYGGQPALPLPPPPASNKPSDSSGQQVINLIFILGGGVYGAVSCLPFSMRKQLIQKNL